MFDFGTARLYPEFLARGQRCRFLSMLSRRSFRLLSLAEIDPTRVHDRREVGLRTVPIERIRGTEAHDDDFDRHFHPLHKHVHDRWMSVAQARDREVGLPPVELIQVGDLYFVRDGHHRISVACALGQQYIEAEVTVCQVSGPLSWEESTHPPNPRNM